MHPSFRGRKLDLPNFLRIILKKFLIGNKSLKNLSSIDKNRAKLIQKLNVPFYFSKE
jgi:hypothetical protein